jgi:glutamyl/glutaminyl-tRNA synthetase
LDLENLFERVKDFWPESALNFDESYRKKVLKLIQERLKYFSEVPELSNFFFEDLPINNDLIKTNKNLKNLSQEELISLLNKSKQALEASNFNLDDLVSRLNDLLAETNQKPATLFSLIRIATTQATSSPGLAETLEVLGSEVTIKRITKQIDIL